MQNQAIEEADRLKAYREAFDDVWSECSKGHTNHSKESTVEGPLKTADVIADVYFKGL